MKNITINGTTYNTTTNAQTIKRMLRAAYLNLQVEDLERVGLYNYKDVQPGWMAHRLAEFILKGYEFEGWTKVNALNTTFLGLSYIMEKMEDMPDNTTLTEKETQELILEAYMNDMQTILEAYMNDMQTMTFVPGLYDYFQELKEEQERREAEGTDELEHYALYGYYTESDFLASLI